MHPDLIINRIAAKQHGIVSYAQLLGAGLSRTQVAWRIRTGLLTRVHHGVFRVGPVAAPLSAEMAAALATGPRATISHGSALVVWGLMPAHPESVHVTAPVGLKGRAGVTFHRGTLLESEREHRHGIPVTGVARSLLDFAATAEPRLVEQAVAEALARRLASERRLDAIIERHAGARGARTLRELIAGGPALVRSEAEAQFLALVRGTELPRPEVNVPVSGYEIDFLWRKAGIAVEVDGHRYHRFRFEQDRKRDAVLRTQGISVIRVTWQQLEREPVAVMVRLALLVGREASGSCGEAS